MTEMWDSSIIGSVTAKLVILFSQNRRIDLSFTPIKLCYRFMH